MEKFASPILVDGRTLLEPQSGGVFTYVSQLIPELKSLGLKTWANAMEAAPAGTVDRQTRLPNKLLHASVRSFGGPRFDTLAGFAPRLFWAPNLHFIAPPADAPFVLTIHDLSFERYPEFFSPRRRLWHQAVGPKKLCERADAILAVSEHTKRDIVELYGIPEEKITVTHLGVDACHPDQRGGIPFKSDSSTPLRSGRNDNRFILHVGTLEPRKNHLALIDAFHLLKNTPGFDDLSLVLAGPKGWKNDAVVRAIATSPWRDSIQHLGFITPEQQAQLYREASVFAFPSFYEGFGLPPLEAMAAGTPVVASFAASLGEVIGDAGILIDPYRPAELADALRSVLESPSLATELSRRGQERASRFTWKSCAEKTAGVFEALAD